MYNSMSTTMIHLVIELREALLANRDGIAAALELAETELTACRRRCLELEELIGRARLILGLDESNREPLTLHDAMGVVLRDHGDGLTAPALAEEVNKRHLYQRKNGKPVEPGQIHARVTSYQAMFTRQAGRIVLRELAALR